MLISLIQQLAFSDQALVLCSIRTAKYKVDWRLMALNKSTVVEECIKKNFQDLLLKMFDEMDEKETWRKAIRIPKRCALSALEIKCKEGVIDVL